MAGVWEWDTDPGQYRESAYRLPLLSFCPLYSFWSKLTSASLLDGRRNRSGMEHIWMCSGRGSVASQTYAWLAWESIR